MTSRGSPGQASGSGLSIDAFAGAFVSAIKQSLQGAGNDSPSTSAAATSDSAVVPSKKVKFNAPSLFESLRREPKTRRRGKWSKAATPKTTCYVRDIILLPNEFKGEHNDVSIPRSRKRSMLAQAGLVGKIEINSGMTPGDVRRDL